MTAFANAPHFADGWLVY